MAVAVSNDTLTKRNRRSRNYLLVPLHQSWQAASQADEMSEGLSGRKHWIDARCKNLAKIVAATSQTAHCTNGGQHQK
jgi:hypothetical protein